MRVYNINIHIAQDRAKITKLKGNKENVTQFQEKRDLIHSNPMMILSDNDEKAAIRTQLRKVKKDTVNENIKS